VVECRDERDFALKAFAANLKHGLPLRREEVRHVTQLLAARGLKVSEIARATGIPERTVRHWVGNRLREVAEALRRQAWELKARGLSERRIAQELGVSPSTVHGWLSPHPPEEECSKSASLPNSSTPENPEHPAADLSPEEAARLSEALAEGREEIERLASGESSGEIDLFTPGETPPGTEEETPEERREAEEAMREVPLRQLVRTVVLNADLLASTLFRTLELIRTLDESDPESVGLLRDFLVYRIVKAVFRGFAGADPAFAKGFLGSLAEPWLEDVAPSGKPVPEHGLDLSFPEWIARREKHVAGREWSEKALLEDYLPRVRAWEALAAEAAALVLEGREEGSRALD